MLPNFILIGTAKGGTTALYWYLAEHPEVFMTPMKETNYFAFRLDEEGRLLYGDPDVHRFPVRSLGEYERLFADAGDAVAVGEASPIYLECPLAANRIRELLPGARLICSLRHPVERAYSDYQMYLRRRGRRLDPVRDLTTTAAWARADSRWMRIGRYYEQLRRYFDAFPRDQIYVLLFDDLKQGALPTVQNIYRFLGVDPEFTPDLNAPHNVGGMPESRVLEALLTNQVVRSVVGSWIPTGAANWVRRLRMKNMRAAPPLPRELRTELTGPFRDDIERTGELVGRNLNHWL